MMREEKCKRASRSGAARTAALLLGLLVAVLCVARAAAAQTELIRAGHLIDPATGTASENEVILVENGKIQAVGRNVSIPAGAKVYDLSDAWVLPGLMDAHTHITMNLPLPGMPVWGTKILTESSALRALRGMHNAEIILQAGFTALRDVGNSANYADADVRRAIERGWFPGPTIINSGKIIAPFGGQYHEIAPEFGPFWDFEYVTADSPEQIRAAVRQNIYYGAKMIKLVADEYAYCYSEDEIRAAVSEAHLAGLKVAVHTYGGRCARNAILGGADSIEHGFDLSDDLLRLMKEKGTYLVGTDFPYKHLVALAYGRLSPKETSAKIIDRLRCAYRIGVKMAFGSDTVVNLPGENRAQMMQDYFQVWREAGIPPSYILKALTTNAADLLGIEKERGAIAPGLAADIIAVRANPLADIEALRTVRFVMKDGQVVRDDR